MRDSTKHVCVYCALYQADARQYKRAEKMHDMVHKFLMMHVGCVGDKVKELDTWRIFLEDLDRKVNILHWIRTDDIWYAYFPRKRRGTSV